VGAGAWRLPAGRERRRLSYCLGRYIDLYRYEETHGKKTNKKKTRAKPESKMLKAGEETVDMAV
jgi:hypothetical protein